MRTAERSNPRFDERSVVLSDAEAARVSRPSFGPPDPTAETPLEPFARPEAADPWLDETEFDSIEEVDAVARSLRRVAIEYGVSILLILLTVPVLSLVAPWWFARPIWGGFTVNFLVVAILLHVAFLVLALLYNRVARRSEAEMLGRWEDGEEWGGD